MRYCGNFITYSWFNISSKCTDLSGLFTGGGGCCCGLCSADSFNCLMVFFSLPQKTAVLFYRLFCTFAVSPNLTTNISLNMKSCLLSPWFVCCIIKFTLYFQAWWYWRKDPGNRPCWVHLQHWRLHLTAGEGGQFQALRHPASHIHSPQRGGRRTHIPDS